MLHETEVRRGMALLDEVYPPWFHEVDLDRLNINSCTDCVLGQLCGNYCEREAFDARLGLTYPESQAHGFSYDDGHVEMGSLTDTWRILIQQRRDAMMVDVPRTELESSREVHLANAN